jgi:hypothetical protein
LLGFSFALCPAWLPCSARTTGTHVDPSQASAGDDAAANTCQCASARRDQSPQARLHAADQRDVTAYTRDQAVLTRDGAADARGLKLAQRDAADEHDNDARAVTGSEVIVLAAGKRKRASRPRAQTAEQDAAPLRIATRRQATANRPPSSACTRSLTASCSQTRLPSPRMTR